MLYLKETEPTILPLSFVTYLPQNKGAPVDNNKKEALSWAFIGVGLTCLVMAKRLWSRNGF